jgi:predicted RNase H-like HicB family nuclease
MRTPPGKSPSKTTAKGKTAGPAGNSTDGVANGYPFSMKKLSPSEGGGFVVSFPDLPGCNAHGGTTEDAICNGRKALDSWIAGLKIAGNHMPEPNSRPLLTATEVVEVFKSHGGRGPVPDEGMVRGLVLFLNMGGPFGLSPARLRSHFAKAKRDGFRKTIDGRYRDAIWTILETGPQIIRFRQEQIESPTGGMLFSLGQMLGQPQDDKTTLRQKFLSKANLMLDFHETAVKVAALFPPPPGKGKRRADWHPTAQSLAPMVVGAFRQAGRRKVSLANPTAPAIKVIVWALGFYGHCVDEDAVVKLFKRQIGTTRTP